MSAGDRVTLTVQNNKADVDMKQGGGAFTRWGMVVDGVPNADKHVQEVVVTTATQPCTAARGPLA